MRIILGIGNPGKRYLNTRHNAGFLLLDYYAEKNKLSFKASSYEYYYSERKTGDAGFSLIMPTTYVNNSGIAAAQVLEEYNETISELLVIADDINLPLAQIRVRASGGDGGHNGLKSLIYHLNSNQFPRIRIGVGNPENTENLVDHVLSKFSEDEFKLLKSSFDQGSILIDEFIKGGQKAMMDANSKMLKAEKDLKTGKTEEQENKPELGDQS